MKITDHILQGDSNRELASVNSPNHSGDFSPGNPDTIIIHYTAGRNAGSSINTLCDPNVKASAHLVIGRDMSITQLVPFNIIAWHAGKSAYEGRKGFNKYSIGIEIDNAGELTKQGDEYVSWFGARYTAYDVFEGIHRNQTRTSYWHRYTKEQIEITEEICRMLIKEYNIKHILGHEEIAPGRKTDPGPAFPLDKLRDKLLFADRDEDEGDEHIVHDNESGIVTAGKLNIRSLPDVNSKKVAEPLPKGTVVNITGESGDWYNITVETKGWVSKNYIRKE